MPFPKEQSVWSASDLRSLALFHYLVRLQPQRLGMSRPELIPAALSDALGPETRRFMLRLLLLQFPHAPVIFFPESCCCSLGYIEHKDSNRPCGHLFPDDMVPRRNVPDNHVRKFLDQRYPVPAYYRSRRIRPSLLIIDSAARQYTKPREEQKDCRYGREESFLIHVSPSGSVGTTVRCY